MFDTAVTLKYNQGHRKWYEWVKVSEYYYQAKFEIYHVYSFRENRNVKVFATCGQSAGQSNTDHYIDSHFSCESKTFAVRCLDTYTEYLAGVHKTVAFL